MKIQKCRKKSHHFLTLWPWPLTYDLENLIRSGHYHYQCVYQIWEQSIPWFLSYRVNTIVGGGRLRRKTITSPDPSDTGDIITHIITWLCDILALVWHFGPACVTFRPGLCDILALSCVTKASACHHTLILTTGAVYRKFHRSSVSKTT